MKRIAFLVAVLVAAAVPAIAADPSRTSLAPGSGTPSHQLVLLKGLVTYEGEPCPSSGGLLPPMEGSMTLRRDGEVEQAGIGFFLAFYRECSAGTATAGMDIRVHGVTPGRHTFRLEYSGSARLAPSASGELVVDVPAEFTVALPADGTIKAAVAEPTFTDGAGFSCLAREVSLATSPSPPPAGVAFPGGVLRYAFSGCGYSCGFLCPPNTPDYPAQRIVLEYPAPIPANATFLIRTQRAGTVATTWQPLQATIVGSHVAFMVRGDSNATAMEGEIGMATGPTPYAVQDIWWGGPSGNGWGVSIAQSGEQLFAVFYVYRDDGTPLWVVMSGGTWDLARRRFQGNLYVPTGSPFHAYDATRFRAGNPVGTATLQFTSRDTITLSYTVGAASGSKSLTRFGLSPRPLRAQHPDTDIWWGGASQDGWGVAVTQHDATSFLTWYTYDEAGQPAWFFATLETQVPHGIGGTLYASRSSPWLGVPYDASRLQATPVGTVSLALPQRGSTPGSLQYSVNGRSGTIGLQRLPF